MRRALPLPMAPASHPSSLDECLDLVDDMKKMYAGNEDANLALRMRRWQEDIFAAFKQRDNHMATLIRGARTTADVAIERDATL